MVQVLERARFLLRARKLGQAIHDMATESIGSQDDGLAQRAVRGFRLDVVEGTRQGTSWTSTGPQCTVGSHPSCDLVLGDGTVSGFHCEIAVAGEGIRVRDLGSRNGVYVDGVRVIEAFLRGGCTLRLGRSAIRFQYLAQRNRVAASSHRQFGSLVGESWIMRELFAELERVAATDVKVLLEGATGTGKSAAARAIHAEGARAQGPFVMLDCGAIPADLLESELFGHVQGAFTGATRDRAGAFEEAAGGTLFLDEIGELPLQLQPKLLTVLDTGTVRRVGSNAHRTMDVRVIAATNRDLRIDVNVGRFRKDLYYRLAVVCIRLPELRQRPEDLPQLVRTLLGSLGAVGERADAIMTRELMTAVRSGAWPGNVRQLRNYLEQCLVYGDVMPTDAAAIEPPPSPGESPVEIDATLPWSEARERVIAQAARLYFRELLHRHGGNVTRAAAAAGVHRGYLHRLLGRHDVER
jgi:two-component system response regulator GlrR